MQASYVMLILMTHYFADFVCQTPWMAENKSKDNTALLSHVTVYTLSMTVAFLWVIPNIGLALTISLVNGYLHFITDWFTSRISSICWKEKDFHNFFVVVGFDQLVHQTCLIYSLYLFS